MNATIDLNADLGEGFPLEDQILDLVTSASLACGGHAGEPHTLRLTLASAKLRGVVIGAHPGYPDRANFGRLEWRQGISALEIEQLMNSQIHYLQGLGAIIHFVKPHGALYNQAQQLASIAQGIVAAVAPHGWPILGLAGGCVEQECRSAGLRFIAEGFADRRYQPNGQLVPRSQPDAVLTDPAEIAAQVLQLVEQRVETLCLHGDNPHAVSLALLIRSTLRDAKIDVHPFINL